MHFTRLLVAAIPLTAGIVSGDAIICSEADYKGTFLLAADWDCHNLQGPLKHHVGSIMVPQDWTCSLHMEPNCETAEGGVSWSTSEYIPDVFSEVPDPNLTKIDSIMCGP